MPVATPFYAWAPSLDPQSGDLVFAGNAPLPGSPALQKVLIVLRTQLGSCPSDPLLGVDWQQVATLLPSAPATCRTIVLAGLQRMVDAGEITNVTVTAQVVQQALLYEVTFFDVRLGKTVPTGRLTAGGTSA